MSPAPTAPSPADPGPDEAKAWIVPGLSAERSFTVTEADTALFAGGDLAVVGTPVLIQWAEHVAADLIRAQSGGQLGSVGTRVNIRHTESAVPGDQIKVAVSLLSSVFKMTRFAVTVTNDRTGYVLLTGEHDRALLHRPV